MLRSTILSNSSGANDWPGSGRPYRSRNPLGRNFPGWSLAHPLSRFDLIFVPTCTDIAKWKMTSRSVSHPSRRQSTSTALGYRQSMTSTNPRGRVIFTVDLPHTMAISMLSKSRLYEFLTQNACAFAFVIRSRTAMRGGVVRL